MLTIANNTAGRTVLPPTFGFGNYGAAKTELEPPRTMALAQIVWRDQKPVFPDLQYYLDQLGMRTPGDFISTVYTDGIESGAEACLGLLSEPADSATKMALVQQAYTYLETGLNALIEHIPLGEVPEFLERQQMADDIARKLSLLDIIDREAAFLKNYYHQVLKSYGDPLVAAGDESFIARLEDLIKASEAQRKILVPAQKELTRLIDPAQEAKEFTRFSQAVLKLDEKLQAITRLTDEVPDFESCPLANLGAAYRKAIQALEDTRSKAAALTSAIRSQLTRGSQRTIGFGETQYAYNSHLRNLLGDAILLEINLKETIEKAQEAFLSRESQSPLAPSIGRPTPTPLAFRPVQIKNPRDIHPEVLRKFMELPGEQHALGFQHLELALLAPDDEVLKDLSPDKDWDHTYLLERATVMYAKLYIMLGKGEDPETPRLVDEQAQLYFQALMSKDGEKDLLRIRNALITNLKRPAIIRQFLAKWPAGLSKAFIFEHLLPMLTEEHRKILRKASEDDLKIVTLDNFSGFYALLFQDGRFDVIQKLHEILGNTPYNQLIDNVDELDVVQVLKPPLLDEFGEVPTETWHTLMDSAQIVSVAGETSTFVFQDDRLGNERFKNVVSEIASHRKDPERKKSLVLTDGMGGIFTLPAKKFGVTLRSLDDSPEKFWFGTFVDRLRRIGDRPSPILDIVMMAYTLRKHSLDGIIWQELVKAIMAFEGEEPTADQLRNELSLRFISKLYCIGSSSPLRTRLTRAIDKHAEATKTHDQSPEQAPDQAEEQD